MCPLYPRDFLISFMPMKMAQQMWLKICFKIRTDPGISRIQNHPDDYIHALDKKVKAQVLPCLRLQYVAVGRFLPVAITEDC